jgi:hypothetical protein
LLRAQGLRLNSSRSLIEPSHLSFAPPCRRDERRLSSPSPVVVPCAVCHSCRLGPCDTGRRGRRLTRRLRRGPASRLRRAPDAPPPARPHHQEREQRRGPLPKTKSSDQQHHRRSTVNTRSAQGRRRQLLLLLFDLGLGARSISARDSRKPIV